MRCPRSVSAIGPCSRRYILYIVDSTTSMHSSVHSSRPIASIGPLCVPSGALLPAFVPALVLALCGFSITITHHTSGSGEYR